MSWYVYNVTSPTVILSYHIHMQASHAQDIGAAAIGVMPTTFFKPSSIGNETL